jgi:hypothetical protein
MKSFVVILISILIFSFSIGYVEAQTHQLQTHRLWHYDLGKLEYNMSTEQVRKIWGRPNRLNHYAEQGQELQQWIYIESPSIKIYLYFENGVFTSYQLFGDR